MAQIKRIQLRGISRTPSDRLTADGGCAESLNVYLDNDEIAPVVRPKDITDSIMPSDAQGEPIYIHATQAYKNIITLHNNRIYYGSNSLILLENGENIADIAHIGNTLVICTDRNKYYLAFKSGQYTTLGGDVPFPTLRITAALNAQTTQTLYETQNDTLSQPDQDMMFNPGKWNSYDEDGTNSYDIAQGAASALSEELNRWDTTSSAAPTMYIWPIVARYGLRLYDGSYIMSLPILLAPQNIRGFYYAKGIYEHSDSYPDDNGTAPGWEKVKVNAAFAFYKPHVQLLDYVNEKDLWADIIQGVDIFFSDEIKPTNINCIGVESVESEYNYATADILLGGTRWKEEDAILEKSVFFKVASFEFSNQEDVDKLYDGFSISRIKQEELYLKDQLDPYKDLMESGTIIPQALSTFNNRLVAGNILNRINAGPKYIVSTDSSETTRNWYFRFYIEKDGQLLHVLRQNIEGHDFFTGYNPGAWIAYPDVKCVRVDVATGDGYYVSIPMKEHPRLNCSYGYLGRKPLSTYTVANASLATSVIEKKNNDIDEIGNKIYLSEVDNPIIFPIANRYTVGSGNIIGMAVAAQALSQGQFGKFPLYVFTTDGIWTLSTNDQGTFSAAFPLSKEICDNPNSIIPLEQEVVFTTKKGVMLLAGSEVTELSPNMNGKHYIIESSAKAIVETQPGFEDLADVAADSTPFMAFIDSARCAYDYTGKRLLLVNPYEDYQYVYKFDTQTWHKISLADKIVDVLNSYPECYVVTEGSHIINFSTILDSAEEQITEKGIIVTRPFDLDEPDVFKTITDIRVRGQFQKGSVNFILLGSNDGINFYTISSLRGKAWKQFRIILLSKLSQHERISWIDVQYDTKFTNRLR